MVAKLLGVTLGNRGGLEFKIRFYLSKECMFTAQGPQVLCFMDSRRFSMQIATEVAVVQFAQVKLVENTIITSLIRIFSYPNSLVTKGVWIIVLQMW